MTSQDFTKNGDSSNNSTVTETVLNDITRTNLMLLDHIVTLQASVAVLASYLQVEKIIKSQDEFQNVLAATKEMMMNEVKKQST